MRLGRRELWAASLLALAVGCRRPPLAVEDGGHPAGGTGGPSSGAAGGGGTGGTPAGAFCATIAREARPIRHPDVLILLDASGSMNQDLDGMVCDGGCGAGSKWTQATAAVNGLVAATATSVRWGLKLFADGGGTCTVTNRAIVPVAADSASAIATALAARTDANGGVISAGNTPTRQAEQSATAYLATLGGEGKKVILLVTDGTPNCAPEGREVDDSPAAVQAIADALSSGIPTIVVGTRPADGPASATLTSMATAGGYARTTASPAYYPVSAAGDVAATLEALSAPATDCVYTLPEAPTATPSERPIGVQVDGVDVPRDRSHVSGWDYVNASLTAVQIFGSVCGEIQEGQHRTVTIGFYCRGTL